MILRLGRFTFSLKGLIAFLHDLAMTVAALVAAYLLRFGSEIGLVPWNDVAVLVVMILPVAAIAFWAFGLYSGIWRFASVPDLVAVVKAVSVLTVFLVSVDFLTRTEILVPRTVAAVYWFVGCAALGGPRLMFRIYRDGRLLRRRGRSGGPTIPVLIAGTGSEAEVIIRSLETTPEEILDPVGLLTTKPSHLGQRIRRVPVLGSLQDIEEVVALLVRRGCSPKHLILTQQALGQEADIETIIARARRLGLNAERLSHPGLVEEGGTKRITLTPVRVEDLLSRETRDLDQDMIRTLVTGRRVLVTGGGGTIGSELCRQVAAMGCGCLMIVENSEFALYEIGKRLRQLEPGLIVDERLCDVRDRRRITRLIEEFRPDLVFHAAALKHVPIVERHVTDGLLTNTIGTINVADAARKARVRAMIMISTDKAVRPVSVMGATKRAAESYCEALDAISAKAVRSGGSEPTRFMSVRFGNVLGSSGSVVPLFQEQIEHGGPVTVTHPDMKRFFMTIDEAVRLVLTAAALGVSKQDRVSIYVLDMGEPIRIAELAERMIRLAGFEPGQDIRIEFTGVRPGERLDEELFDTLEPLSRTEFQGILAAEARTGAPEAILAAFKALSQAVTTGDERAMLQCLKEVVPEYGTAGPVAAAPAAASISSPSPG